MTAPTHKCHYRALCTKIDVTHPLPLSYRFLFFSFPSVASVSIFLFRWMFSRILSKWGFFSLLKTNKIWLTGNFFWLVLESLKLPKMAVQKNTASFYYLLFFCSFFEVNVTKTILIMLMYNLLAKIDWFDVISSRRYHQKWLTIIITTKLQYILRYTSIQIKKWTCQTFFNFLSEIHSVKKFYRNAKDK